MKNQIIKADPTSEEGSTIYLEDPGLIHIINSLFRENIGIKGTCISFSETNHSFAAIITENEFRKNFALMGAAGIYLVNSFDRIDFFRNYFSDNKAIYGNDYATSPFRFCLQRKNFNSCYQEDGNKQIKIKNVPGITEINLDFLILDYYGQIINSLNDGVSELSLRYFDDFSQSTDKSIKIAGKSRVAITNGYLLFHFCNHALKNYRCGFLCQS